MWVLEYSYTAEDEQVISVSCALRLSTAYSVGRSSKNSFIIKNDKSISRQHVTIEVTSQDNIRITNQGKLSYVDSKYLKPGQIISKEGPEQCKQIIIKLGTNPIIVTIRRIEVLIDISFPGTLRSTLKSLEKIGIYQSHNNNNNNNDDSMQRLTIDNGKMNYSKYIYLLLNNSKIYDPAVLRIIEKTFLVSHNDFNTHWSHIIDSNNYIKPSYLLPETLKDINFIFLLNEDDADGKHYFIKAMELVDVSYNIFTNNLAFESFLQNNNTLNSTVIIKSEEFQLGFDLLELLNNIRIFKPKEIVTALQTNSIKSLCTDHFEVQKKPPVREKITGNKEIDYTGSGETLANRKQERKENISLEENPTPPVKKRRLNRRKVKPLNPLEFFAGGNEPSFKEDARLKDSPLVDRVQLDNKFPDINKVGEPITEQGTLSTSVSVRFQNKSNEKVFIVRNAESNDIDGKSSSEIRVESPQTTNMSEKLHQSKSDNMDITQGISSKENTNLSAVANSFDKHNRKLSNTINENIKSARERSVSNGEIHRKNDSRETLENPNSNSFPKVSKKLKQSPNIVKEEQQEMNIQRPPTIVETIQATKNKEVNRIKSRFVEVNSSELTEDAINEFKNLSVVEENSHIMRSTREKPNTTENWFNQYSGRKNFKKFMKIWPKSQQTNDSVRNSANLITRDYVTLKPYSKGNKMSHKDYDVGSMINENFSNEKAMIDGDFNRMRQPKLQDDTLSNPAITSDKSRMERDMAIDNSESDGEQFSFRRSEGVPRSNGLFVQDDEEDGNSISENDRDNGHDGLDIATSHSISNHVREEEKQQKKKNTNFTSGLDVRDSIAARVRSHPPPHNNREDYDDDGDDDEDDDGPKFKFRRKR